MTKIPIEVIIDSPIDVDPNQNMPEYIKRILSPMECDEGSKVYVPEVKVYRLDLSEDSAFTILIPKEAANKLRAYFGTYDYRNLKSDYERFLPSLKIGEYLTKPSTQDISNDSFYYDAKDLAFDTNQFDDIDSIMQVLQEALCEGKISVSKKIYLLAFTRESGHKAEDTVAVAIQIRKETEQAKKIENEREKHKALDEVYAKYKALLERGSNDDFLRDYDAWYELALNRVAYGKYHEAFARLEKAVSLAVKEKEGRILLGKITDDLEWDENNPGETQRGIKQLISYSDDFKRRWKRLKRKLKPEKKYDKKKKKPKKLIKVRYKYTKKHDAGADKVYFLYIDPALNKAYFPVRLDKKAGEVDPDLSTFYYQDGDFQAVSEIVTLHDIQKQELDGQLISPLHWERQEGQTKTILNFECKKAVLKKGGDEIVAWYTPQLPYSFGPASFMGLEGLILEIEGPDFNYKVLGSIAKTTTSDIPFVIP